MLPRFASGTVSTTVLRLARRANSPSGRRNLLRKLRAARKKRRRVRMYSARWRRGWRGELWTVIWRINLLAVACWHRFPLGLASVVVLTATFWKGRNWSSTRRRFRKRKGRVVLRQPRFHQLIIITHGDISPRVELNQCINASLLPAGKLLQVAFWCHPPNIVRVVEGPRVQGTGPLSLSNVVVSVLSGIVWLKQLVLCQFQLLSFVMVHALLRCIRHCLKYRLGYATIIL